VVGDRRWLQEQALALARRLGATELPAPFTGDLLYTYAALNEPEKAYRTLTEWLAQRGGVTAADRHHQCAAVALAYLGVGRLEEAEQALALGPFPHPTDVHLECRWTWVSGEVLCARGRYAQARDLCVAYLGRAAERKDEAKLTSCLGKIIEEDPSLALTQRRILATGALNALFMQPTGYAGDVGQPEQRVGQVGFRLTF